MVTISKNVRVTEERGTEKRSMLREVNKCRSKLSSLYCIVCATPREGVLEIIPLHIMALEKKSRELFVVGIAHGREEALALLQSILTEVYEKTGDFDVRKVYAE